MTHKLVIGALPSQKQPAKTATKGFHKIPLLHPPATFHSLNRDFQQGRLRQVEFFLSVNFPLWLRRLARDQSKHPRHITRQSRLNSAGKFAEGRYFIRGDTDLSTISILWMKASGEFTTIPMAASENSSVCANGRRAQAEDNKRWKGKKSSRGETADRRIPI